MDEPTSAIEYRPDRGMMVVLLVICLVFVGLGLWLVTQGFLVTVLGVVSIVFGGFGLVALPRNLSAKAWTIRADSSGLSFGPGSNGDGWSLPWPAIEKVGAATMQSQRMLGVALVDAADAAASMPATAAARLVRIHRGARFLGGAGMASGASLGRLFSPRETIDAATEVITSPARSVVDGFAVSRRLSGFDIGISNAALNAPIDDIAEQLERMRQVELGETRRSKSQANRAPRTDMIGASEQSASERTLALVDAALWAGVIPPERLPAVATALLADDADSPSIRVLAGLDLEPFDPRDARDLFLQVLEECSIESVAVEERVDAVAHLLAFAYVNGRIATARMFQLFHRLVLAADYPDHYEVMYLYGLEDEWQCDWGRRASEVEADAHDRAARLALGRPQPAATALDAVALTD